MSSTTTSNPAVKIIGLVTVIAGLLMMVAGGLTWGLVSTQLKAEKVTVSAVTPRHLAVSPANRSPARSPPTPRPTRSSTTHLPGANDRTYAQLEADAKVLKEKLAAAGASDADVAKDVGAKA